MNNYFPYRTLIVAKKYLNKHIHESVRGAYQWNAVNRDIVENVEA
jgi:hypothetical protein